MENREILIANTKTQTRNKVITNATTLGELKTALDNAGINYEGMTFTEGISKTQLLNDDTQLPQNLMYKGQPTNNLVILLTNTKKKIASGSFSRADAYAIIRNRNLQDAVKKHFGRNFTQVPTHSLLVFIEESKNGSSDNSSKPVAENHPTDSCLKSVIDNPSNRISVAETIADSFCTVVDRLYKEAVISLNELPFISQRVEDAVNGLLGGTLESKPSFFVPSAAPVKETVTSKSSKDSIEIITDDDLDDMIDDLDL